VTPAAEKVLGLLDFFTEEIGVLALELEHLGVPGQDLEAGFEVADLKPIRQRVAQAHHKLSGLMDKILRVHRRGHL